MDYVKLSRVTGGDFRRKVLFDLDWVWGEGEVWAVTGSNGSGKSALVALLVGELLVYSGSVTVDPRLGAGSWVGFEPQKRLLDAERRADLSDVSESPDAGTTVLSWVGSPDLIHRVGLSGKETRGLKQLSTGELRRTCLARAWNETFWVLDEPYEGLDPSARQILEAQIETRIASGLPVLFLSRRVQDFPKGVTHVWELQDGRTVFQGAVADWLGTQSQNRSPAVAQSSGASTTPGAGRFGVAPNSPIIEFSRVTAGYADLAVLTDFSWTVHPGEHWLVRGPNGSGKSTLLGLVSGEHPQAFQAGVRIFGKLRGSELTWAELHRRISHLSYAVHQRFRDLWFTTLEEVVVAAFQDAVRPVVAPTWDQLAQTRTLLAAMNLPSESSWEDLSWGVQRLALLARALVTDPELLLLDEPCQGLDEAAESRFQAALMAEVTARQTTVVYVTHRAEERPLGDFRVLDLPQ